MHLRLHTHETAGVSVSAYMAALEAGVDGIDLAAAPVSGGTSQPDILTMLHATKGLDYDLGGLEIDKVLTYEKELHACLEDYFLPPEATTVSPIIQFSPMPGGALTANTQMMRDDNTLDKFPEVIKAMQEVVEKGGYGTSVTPVSQFYWQQAYANVMFGPWKQIAPGYGKMVLGYFGNTPVKPDAEVVELASKKLKLEPTKRNPLDIADEDPRKSLVAWKERLELEELEVTDENIFIAAACEEKGIAFLKGESPLNVRKTGAENNDKKEGDNVMADGNYTVVVDGQKFSVQVAKGNADIQVVPAPVATPTATPPAQSSGTGTEVGASVNGSVWKILVNTGDKVEKGQVVAILEAMKMEIDIEAPVGGIISQVSVKQNDSVEEGQTIVVIG
jgi:pyruvate carboxylase subunit B